MYKKLKSEMKIDQMKQMFSTNEYKKKKYLELR
jgi:hypothetical protein